MKKLLSVLTAITMLIALSNFNILASNSAESENNVNVYVEDMSEYGYSEFVVKQYDTSKTRVQWINHQLQ